MPRTEFGFGVGFLGPLAPDAPGGRRSFDWDRAAEIIRTRQPQRASAGLERDWDYTAGAIYEGGSPVPEEDTYTYLSSTWAVPTLHLEFSNGQNETIECWVSAKDKPEWDEKTYWPESARRVLIQRPSKRGSK